MLTIYGRQSRFCDGISRRNFIKIGALGLGGLALPQLLQAEARAGIRKSHKAIIMIYLPGGPPHQDMFDIKVDAPPEIRGEFKAIKTNVPGIRICEHLPSMAAVMDKLAILRSIVGAEDNHYDYQCMTGRLKRTEPPGGWPSIGAVISKLQGPANPGVPPFVGLEPVMQHKPYNASGPGFLGIGNRSFRPAGEGKTDLALNGISLERLADRKALLASFDQFQRDVDASGLMAGLDAFNEQAFGMLTSSQLLEALDFQKESPRVIERYGKGDPKVRGDAAPRLLEQFLIARRLVEAGARVVTVAFGFWDYHSNNFKTAREDMPMLDRGVSALVQDLHDRGMDKDVSVVVWGEFGRTPTINKDGGRDHWPRVSCAVLAGGGMKTGQVIGATDRLGGEAADRPVHFQEVFATLYHNMGIDVNKATVTDLSGRPHFLVDGYQPMREVVG
ncbi:MAG: DUF1501 domain-containing protein [Verrucomicrobia subdivision 3 bacterium]|nr:DUF1501 domain-containing protein [Limisphaerales bacterium]